ncbi:MAG: hypothetical protein JWR80_7602 [Bradyrhizobium sp.]|nr:hypothetical protein [Bradyrhizobium sp.]
MAGTPIQDASAHVQPCAGVKVLELSCGFGVSALCGQLFAGLGATVKLVDLARGAAETSEAEDYQFRLLHADKALITERAASNMASLIAWSDVVIVDRTAAKEFPELSDVAGFERAWPGKVLCQVSLFGAHSSRPDWVGNELIAEAAGALMACNGYPERAPVVSGLPYALHTAALFGFSAILTALWERDRSARGQSIDLAVVDCITAVLGNFLPSYFLSGRSPQRIGNRHTIAAPWNIYPASDGSVVICTGTGGTGWWAKVMAVLERPELTDDPRFVTEADRVRNVDEVDAIVGDWTSQRTMHDIVELMTVRGIPVSEIGTIEAVLDDPHYRRLRTMVVEDGPKGLPRAGTPLKVGAWHADAVSVIASSTPPPEAGVRRDEIDSGRGGPLAGIRVLEFASRTSAPLAGRMMADFGADVVKIEPIKGDALRGAGQQIGGASYLFHINNAGKRSVVIDPTTPEGRDLILDLARHADIFVENLAPGSVVKMGLGADAMQAVNPDLVYCSVSGFGERSAYGSKRALDTVVQAACGLMYMTGYPDHFPVKLGISAVDLTTAVATFASLLAGLRERKGTGRGGNIDLAMADVGVWMTQQAWPPLLCEGVHPIRLGNRSASACPHDVFPAADDRLVAIAVEADAQWRALKALIGRQELDDPAFDTAQGRLARCDALGSLVAGWTESLGADDIAALCQAAGVPASPVRDLVDLVADPDVTRRGMVVPFHHPSAGDIRLLGNPASLSRTPPAVRGGAPMLGAHSREILSDWLGLSDDTIAALRDDGIIVVPDLPEIAKQNAALAAAHGEG